MALVLGTGGAGAAAAERARRVLAACRGCLRELGRLDAAQLEAVDGIGVARAARIAAAVELGKRVAAALPLRGGPLHGPEDVWRYVSAELADLPHEEFHVVLLNAQHAPIMSRQVTRGILDASLIHPREVFRDAVVHRAAALILVHNHPSGDPEPSSEDVRVTRALARAGDELGIPVLDHVVVANGAYVSLAARGLIRSTPLEPGTAWHVRDPLQGRRDVAEALGALAGP